MTSPEKRNYYHIDKVCRKHSFFGRGKERVLLVQQPLVPVISKDGIWAMKAPLQLYKKPGGHGVLWRVCAQARVFEWLSFHKREKVLVRQINNPIAGVDYGLLAFTGIGFVADKSFGFASCHRFAGASEGVNVRFTVHKNGQKVHGITNIEYAEFEQNGIEDHAIDAKGYSSYPANTNILFADLDAVQSAVRLNPVPGMLINMKHKAPVLDSKGVVSHVQSGRLESMMQNIADDLVAEADEEPASYVTFNHRAKTISATKKPYVQGEKIEGTPLGAFYTDCKNAYEMLSGAGFSLPKVVDSESLIAEGAPFYVRYLPALGPLFSVIQQKLRKGLIEKGSALILEIAELDAEGVELDGALEIIANSPLGFTDEKDILHFEEETSGKCILRNVKVKNSGLYDSFWQRPWDGDCHFKEVFRVNIEGNGEFFAENVTVEGPFEVTVPEGYQLTLYHDEDGELKERFTPLDKGASWYWKYRVDPENTIQLEKAQS
jgi:hypothetical protein